MSSLNSSIAPQAFAWENLGVVVPASVAPSRLAPSRVGLESSQRVDSPNRNDAGHELPAQPKVFITARPSASSVRMRFYPAQLRRLVLADLHALVSGRHQRLTWSGWDRSLPRLYLPVEALVSLLTEAVDILSRSATLPAGVSRPEANRSPSAAINVRIDAPQTMHGAITLALEAPHWQCDEVLRDALNASWFRSSHPAPHRQATGGQAKGGPTFNSPTHPWQRLARQCDMVGGWLSLAGLPGGGTSLLLHLPSDTPRTLVQSWLSRVVVSSSARHDTADDRRAGNALALSLYAIGRSQPETLEQLSAANVRLQSLASPDDYIYRACHGRWIWLTTQSQLPAFLKRPAWQSQQLDRWSLAANSSAVIDMSARVEQRFRQLIGSRVPPVDLRSQSISRGPISARHPHSRVDTAASAARSNHLNVRSHAKVSQPKWRYPI